MSNTKTVKFTVAELHGALWALGNFENGDYHDTNGDKRLYAAICRAYAKCKEAQ